MSYILDALRKSQQARTSGTATGPRGAAHDFSITLPGAGWLATIGLLLLLVLLFAALYFWRSTSEDIPVVAPVAEIYKSAPIHAEPAAVEKISAQSEKPEQAKIEGVASAVRGLEEEAKVAVPVVPKKAWMAQHRILLHCTAQHLPRLNVFVRGIHPKTGGAYVLPVVDLIRTF